MKNFKDIFNKEPTGIVASVYYYNSDKNGYHFRKDGSLYWLDEGFRYL